MQVRETKVRRAGIGGRARLAGELRDMDDEVCRTPLQKPPELTYSTVP